MNRVILIGNGFDLAHGLPTRYEDFINWYWEKWLYNLRICHYRTLADGLCKFSIKTGQDTWQSLLWQHGYTFNASKGVDFVNSILKDKQNFEVIQSHLLYRICKSIQDKKWVDIENEYYTLLKESIYDSEKVGCTPHEINNQLEKLLELLAQYLESLPTDKPRLLDSIRAIIYEPIRVDDISISGYGHFYDHCNNWANQDKVSWYEQMNRYGIKDGLASILRVEVDEFLEKYVDRTIIGNYLVTDYNQFPQQLLRPNNTMLLSFNYTRLTDAYEASGIGHTIHIHGDLGVPEKMIFGYGDELDDDYKTLLNVGG